MEKINYIICYDLGYFSHNYDKVNEWKDKFNQFIQELYPNHIVNCEAMYLEDLNEDIGFIPYVCLNGYTYKDEFKYEFYQEIGVV